MPAGSLEEDFKNYLGLAYARLVWSGTAAFYIILESLKKISSRKTVVIPSFVCPLLPLAIKRAGLKVKVCDISNRDFNFDLEQLQAICRQDNDILAILAVHLAGIPIDFEKIEQLAKKNSIFVIEDCAQALGARYQGKMAGALGDFSFFSLCRGKGLTIYEGGLIASKEREYSAIIDAEIQQRARVNLFAEALKILELFGYWVFYRPWAFWFVWRLPQLFWEQQGNNLRAQAEYFTINFPVQKISWFREAIGHINFLKLDKEISQQRQKTKDYINGLKDVEGIRIIAESAGDLAAYPYLTLLFDDPLKLKKAKKLFKNWGLGISHIYALAITDYGYLKGTVENKDYPNGRILAERTLTLSTSTFLKKRDLDCIIRAIKNL